MQVNVNHEELTKELELLVYPAISATNETNSSNIRKILKKTYFKWLSDNASKFYISHLDPSAPSWLPTAVLRGDQVMRVSLTKKVLTRTFEVIDYLNKLEKVPDRMHFSDAYNKVNKKRSATISDIKILEKELARINEAIKESCMFSEATVHEFNDGYKVVKLLKRDAFRREGDLMGNCIWSHGYFSKHERGERVFYSLRDENNEPHVTFEATHKEPVKFIQVEGKASAGIGRRVLPKYQPYVDEFKKIASEKHPEYSIGDEAHNKKQHVKNEIDKLSNSLKIPDFISFSDTLNENGSTVYGMMAECITIKQKNPLLKTNIVARNISFYKSGVNIIASQIFARTINLTGTNLTSLDNTSYENLIWHRATLGSDFCIELTNDAGIIDLKGCRIEDETLYVSGDGDTSIGLLDLSFSNINKIVLLQGRFTIAKLLSQKKIEVFGDCDIEIGNAFTAKVAPKRSLI